MDEHIDLQRLERLAQLRRFEPRTLEVAKRLFIHGETPKRLSLEYGVNIQRIYAIRRLVLAAAQSLDLPPGWEQVTLAGPKELIRRFQRELAEALAGMDGEADGEESP